MRKVLFLLLFLVVLGATSVSAQVRIGGDGEPHTAAVLDLNTDDTDTSNKGALALPRVSLATNTDELNGATPLTGMLVYNTNASMIDGSGIGVYFFDEGEWVKIRGDGTIASTDLADNAVTNSKIADGAVTRSKLSMTNGNIVVTGLGSTAGSIKDTPVPAGCTYLNSTLTFSADNGNAFCGYYGSTVIRCTRVTAGAGNVTAHYLCFM